MKKLYIPISVKIRVLYAEIDMVNESPGELDDNEGGFVQPDFGDMFG